MGSPKYIARDGNDSRCGQVLGCYPDSSIGGCGIAISGRGHVDHTRPQHELILWPEHPEVSRRVPTSQGAVVSRC